MEELKELLDDLKTEIGAVRNDVQAKFANDMMKDTKASVQKANQPADGGVKAGGGTGVSIEKIKKMEEDIKEMKNKFQKQIDALTTQQALAVATGGGGGTAGATSGNNNAAAVTAALQATSRKIEEQNVAHLKRMTQIDIKVQNALTDIQGATEHFKNMSDKLFRNITHIGNVKNEVNAKVAVM